MTTTKRRLWSGIFDGSWGRVLRVAVLFYPFVLCAQPDILATPDAHIDLQDIVKRGTLRVLYQREQNSGAYPGSVREREILEQFAQEHQLALDWIPVAASWNLIPQLVNGAGDIIVGQGPTLAAGMVNQASFTSPWMAYHEQVVARTDTTRIHALSDLGYRQVALKQSSPAWPAIKQLAEQYPGMDLVVIPEHVGNATIMARVASGLYDVTIADSDFLHYYLPEHPELTSAYDLGESTVKAWAVNINATNLQKTLEQFLFKNQLEWSIAEYARYAGHATGSREDNALEHSGQLSTGSRDDNALEHSGQLSPYDDLVRKYADKYGFDWRLIVAQMHQESQFDPGAVSDMGAEGLMQMLPGTASNMGADNLSDPEANIRAGIKYLSLLRSQFESDLLLEERTWFTLASYNAGPGRVNRARLLAAKMGLDANRWFGNVEKAMLVLAQPVEKDGEMVRNCRCGQTVAYVKEIRNLYHNYVRLTQAGQVARTEAIYIRPYDI